MTFQPALYKEQSKKETKSPIYRTFYHSDEGFEYKKFYSSIFGFTSPIIIDRGLRFTNMFIFRDENKRPYAQYRVPKEFTENPEFKSIGEFLNSYRVYLDVEKNEDFIIYKIYHQFDSLNPDAKDGPLVPKMFEQYIGKAKDLAVETDEITKFKKAEELYIAFLINELKWEKPEFLPVPVISRGNLAGVAYLLFDRDKLRTRTPSLKKAGLNANYRQLILQLTREYESILLESKFLEYGLKPEDPLMDYWEVVQDLIHSSDPIFKRKIKYDFLYDFGEWYPVIMSNKFLLDLGYDEYYMHLFAVLSKESKYVQDSKRDRIKMAIIAIIVDSFAHNVGAHCLVALKWWFEIRYKIASKKFPKTGDLHLVSHLDIKKLADDIVDNMEGTLEFHSFMDRLDHTVDPNNVSFLNVIRFMTAEIQQDILRFENEAKTKNSRFPLPVAHAIFHFFRYLRDKSAFWSGVARDTIFSGQIRSWPALLRDFLNNTLFLGTITHSEGINKIHVHIEILGKDGKIIEGGEYARINLEVMKREKAEAMEEKNTKPLPYKKDPQGYSEYGFLRMGKQFKQIQLELEKLDQVFLPNGVIGQQALYTMFENTLRNIKHYKPQLKAISKGGIKLFISIQETRFAKRLKKKEKPALTEDYCLFKVGTWLHHPQKLTNHLGAYMNGEQEPFLEKGAIIEAHTQQLARRVVDQKGQPILGGSSQDKVCASMLMNNTFFSIDEMNIQEIKRQYYPYVYSTSEKFNDPGERIKGFQPKSRFLHKCYNPNLIHTNSVIRKARYQEEVKKYIDEVEEEGGKGTIQKFFHLWKGKRYAVLKDNFDRETENLSRFGILAADNYQGLPFRTQGRLEDRKETAEYVLRNQGVIRIIEAKEEITHISDPDKQFIAAAETWLTDWLGENPTNHGLQITKPKGDGTYEPIGLVKMEKVEGQDRLHLSYENGYELDPDEARQYPMLPLQHGKLGNEEEEICRVRSHCAFFGQIFKDANINTLAEIDIDHKSLKGPAKLLETILSHMTFFDER
ncbi:MAG: hypothetical protein KDD63_06120, partial [Bacteroidetes bacterium]|nr:hypothetical protein [Bacteroidota bacterium]